MVTVECSATARWSPSAIEVEINQKRDRFYQELAHFYDRLDTVGRVLWCVPTLRMAEKIQGLIHQEVAVRSGIHCFVSQKDIERDSWNAPIVLGNESGKTVRYLLDPGTQTDSNPVWTRFLLDKRKCPHRSTSYAKREGRINLDRVWAIHSQATWKFGTVSKSGSVVSKTSNLGLR